MKHFVPLLLVSICLMLTRCAAYAQSSPDAPAQPGAQSTPAPAQLGAQSTPAPAPTEAQSTPAPAPPEAQSTPTPAEPGPQPTPAVAPRAIDPNVDTVITLPPTPSLELFVNVGADTTLTVDSNCSTCMLAAGRPVGAFAGVAGAATQTVVQTGVDTRFAFEAGLAYGFKKIKNFTLVAEFPALFNPNGDVKSSNLSLARSYSSLFFTPALRIMYAQDLVKHPGYPPLYPWISLGGGLAHFSPSAVNLGGGISGARSSTEGALQAGVGVDYGIYRRAIALRAELRDFYTVPPNLGVTGVNLRHNLFASAGVVFRFGKTCWDRSSTNQKSPAISAAHN